MNSPNPLYKRPTAQTAQLAELNVGCRQVSVIPDQMKVDERQELRRLDRQEANESNILSQTEFTSVGKFEETVTEDTAVLVDPSLLSNQRARGQDVIDPYQVSRQAGLRNQARWRVVASDSDGEV